MMLTEALERWRMREMSTTVVDSGWLAGLEQIIHINVLHRLQGAELNQSNQPHHQGQSSPTCIQKKKCLNGGVRLPPGTINLCTHIGRLIPQFGLCLLLCPLACLQDGFIILIFSPTPKRALLALIMCTMRDLYHHQSQRRGKKGKGGEALTFEPCH